MSEISNRPSAHQPDLGNNRLAAVAMVCLTVLAIKGDLPEPMMLTFVRLVLQWLLKWLNDRR